MTVCVDCPISLRYFIRKVPVSVVNYQSYIGVYVYTEFTMNGKITRRQNTVRNGIQEKDIIF